MPKSKKSDAEKSGKDKGFKALKAEKAGKEKKAKKKDKAEKLKTEIKPEKKITAVKPQKVIAPPVAFTAEQISLRAYYIAERRQAMGWPGDSTNDWVEAERQLKAEARKKASL